MKKLAVLTSGGDSPGMNAAIRAVVRFAIHYGYEVWGVERGYNGLVNDNMFIMNTRSVSDIVHRGGTILKTARCPEFKEVAVMQQAIDNLKKHGIDNLVVIGGDGSFRGAKDLHTIFGLNVIGLPGTIDNDLGYTDYTLGFDTAVNTVLWAIGNVRDTMTSHDRVLMLEVMGRACGDIALFAAVAGGAEYCLVPEKPVDVNAIAADIAESYKRGKTSNLILIAEGCAYLKDDIEKAVFEKVGKQVHYTKLGYIQRGGTPSNFDRIFAAKLGAKAVELLNDNKSGRLVGIKNNAIIDMDIDEALAVKDEIDTDLYRIANVLAQ